MHQQLISRILTALLCLGLAACGGTYKIEDPLNDSVHTSPPATFKVTYKKQPETLPKMTLNGFSIDSYFSADTTQAIGNGDDFSINLIEGSNVFHVDPPFGPQVKFIYDELGPEVVILGSTVDNVAIIDGIVIDEMGVTSLSVNGTDVVVAEDGTFTAEVPIADIYNYEATDTLGHISNTQYASLGLNHDPSFTVKVTQNGLDVAMEQVVNALNGLNLNALMAGSMLYDDTWKGLFGETYGADGFIRNISMSAKEFGLNLATGNNIGFDGVIDDIHIQLSFRLHNGFLAPTVIEVGATITQVDLAGDLQLGVENKAPTVDISNVSFNIEAIIVDDIAPGFQVVLGVLLTNITNLFDGPISDAIVGLLNTKVPDLLEGIIKESYTIHINDGISDHDMAMALNLSSITTSETALFASMAGSVIPIDPDLDIPQPLTGALYTSDTLPDASLNNADFAVSINTNVINQTLASAHSVGLTQMNMAGEHLQFGLPRDENLGGESTINRILINNQTPATISVEDVNGIAGITLSIYGLEMAVESKKNGASTYTSDFAIRLDAKAALAIDVAENNTLDITFPSVPRVMITSLRIGNGNWIANGGNKVADELIATSFGTVLQELAKPIANIQLPSFSCLAFIPKGITAAGEGNAHLNIAGSLAKISDTCDVVIGPSTPAYGRGVGTPLSCASNEEYDAGLCYTPCKSGYNGVGPVCWKKDASYGRGVGTIATRCGSGKENDAGLCYPNCKSGYNGIGPVCWSTRTLSYGRGVGTIPSNIWTGSCPSGKENDAGLCYKYCKSGYNGVGPVCWLKNASYGRGVGTIPKDCGSGKERDAGLCYPICNSGYHGIGPVCWTNQSIAYGRGVGVPIHTCRDGWSKKGLLCFEECDEGYEGIGAVCWPKN